MDRQEQPKDKGLDVPSEANRDKHINFAENEESFLDNLSSEDPSPSNMGNKSADEYGEISRKTKE